jgi:hypothetical protein
MKHGFILVDTRVHKTHLWASENPRAIHEEPLHSVKIGVWCAVSRVLIVGPVIFLYCIVNTEVYLTILSVHLYTS